MIFKWFVKLALFAVVSFASVAHATITYNFTFSGGSSGGQETAYGQLVTTDNGDGSVTAISGYFTGTGPITGTYQLLVNPSAPAVISSPSGYFTYDNLLYPGNSNPLTATGGILFTAGSYEFEIWNSSGGSYSPDSLWDNQSVNYGAGIGFSAYGGSGTATFTMTEAPEANTSIAVALLLLPIAASTVRFLRGKRTLAKCRVASRD